MGMLYPGSEYGYEDGPFPLYFDIVTNLKPISFFIWVARFWLELKAYK